MEDRLNSTTSTRVREGGGNGKESGGSRLNFRQLFADNRDPKNGMKLEYIEPQKIDESDVTVILDEDVRDEIEYWKLALVGYYAGGTPTLSYMRKFVTEQWKHVGRPTLLGHDNGWLIVHFQCVEDRDAILRGGPWTIENQALILKQWSTDRKSVV